MNLNELSLLFAAYAYPLLAGFHLLHAFIRAYRYWQVQRDPWLKWKVVSSLGSSITFGMYSTFVSTAPRLPRDIMVPWARLSTVIILIGLGVAVIGQLHDMLVITKKRDKAFHEKGMNEKHLAFKS